MGAILDEQGKPALQAIPQTLAGDPGLRQGEHIQHYHHKRADHSAISRDILDGGERICRLPVRPIPSSLIHNRHKPTQTYSFQHNPTHRVEYGNDASLILADNPEPRGHPEDGARADIGVSD